MYIKKISHRKKGCQESDWICKWEEESGKLEKSVKWKVKNASHRSSVIKYTSLRGVRDEAIQSELPSLRGSAKQSRILKKSIKLSSIFFIEPKCRISWTATGLSRKKILRGYEEEETVTLLAKSKSVISNQGLRTSKHTLR